METIKLDEDRNVIAQFNFGHGIVGTQAGFLKYTKKSKKSVESDIILPFIDFSHLSKVHEIGEEPIEKPENVIRLTFENIDGLEVLQRALDFCRNKLQENATLENKEKN